MKLAIVIPAFNEERVIGSVLKQLPRKLPGIDSVDTVVVNDGSTDNTEKVVNSFDVIILNHIINRGQGAALKTGIEYVLQHDADIIVTLDADGQHPVDDIEHLIAPILAGTHDVVLGSRFLKDESNIPPLRRGVLKLGVIFTRILSRIKVTDTHNGFRAFSQDAASKIKIVQDRMAHASEILDEIVLNKLRYTEVPVTITYNAYSRTKGQSSFAMFKIAMKFIIAKITH
ncbi:MAG: glycosyltransferase family 2 protein [Candidatus Kerfeldbacteria bacterium]|nr:glycosyltransferase family 2 protein [Candidatus Kerfeldbacteria bacterium]